MNGSAALLTLTVYHTRRPRPTAGRSSKPAVSVRHGRTPPIASGRGANSADRSEVHHRGLIETTADRVGATRRLLAELLRCRRTRALYPLADQLRDQSLEQCRELAEATLQASPLKLTLASDAIYLASEFVCAAFPGEDAFPAMFEIGVRVIELDAALATREALTALLDLLDGASDSTEVFARRVWSAPIPGFSVTDSDGEAALGHREPTDRSLAQIPVGPVDAMLRAAIERAAATHPAVPVLQDLMGDAARLPGPDGQPRLDGDALEFSCQLLREALERLDPATAVRILDTATGSAALDDASRSTLLDVGREVCTVDWWQWIARGASEHTAAAIAGLILEFGLSQAAAEVIATHGSESGVRALIQAAPQQARAALEAAENSRPGSAND